MTLATTSASLGATTADAAMPGIPGDEATSAIVLCDAALAKLARMCQRGSLLLPVANQPIIQFILDTLARSGIRKVTFAGTDQVSCDALSMYLASGASGASSSVSKNVSVDVVCDPSCGKSSVKLIRRVLASDAQHDLSVALDGREGKKSHGSHEDVLVVGSLFVPVSSPSSPSSPSPSSTDADLSLQGQLLYHKVKKAAVTMLMVPAVADDNGEYSTREYVAVRADGVVAAYCPAGTSKSSDVRVPVVALLPQQGESVETGDRLTVRKDVSDVRVCVFNREALSHVLQEDESDGLVDVQKHLIPYFVRRMAVQSAKSALNAKHGGSGSVPRALERMSSSTLSMSGGETERGGESDGDGNGSKRLAVHAYVRSAASLMVVDSEASYANVNREILRYLERSEIAKNVKLGAKAAVNTSIVACNSSLGDRSSVKRSVMGPNCSIGASAKIVNSILHEGVTVGDGCQVHNSILCRGVTLVAKTSLKDCVVGPNCSVPGGNHKGEEFFDE